LEPGRHPGRAQPARNADCRQSCLVERAGEADQRCQRVLGAIMPANQVLSDQRRLNREGRHHEQIHDLECREHVGEDAAPRSLRLDVVDRRDVGPNR
jgi:hypothetical protein